MTSQEIIELTANGDLKQTFSYLVDQCNGELVNYDEGDFMDITVYSECFSKKNLDVLFKHSYYKGCTEIVYSQKYKKLRLTGLEVMKRL